MKEQKRQLVSLHYTFCHLTPGLIMHELSQPCKQMLLKAEFTYLLIALSEQLLMFVSLAAGQLLFA